MQERDVVKIKTDFAKNIISGQIRKILKKSTGYDVDIQFDKLKIVNEDGKTQIHLAGNAKADSKAFKKICMNSGLLKDVISALLSVPSSFLNNLLEKSISGILKNKYGCKVKLHIKDRKYHQNHGESSIYLDTDIEIKTKELEKILKNI